ncbi:Gfo/Idh/MocA family oxidoreductase [Arenibacter sp. GZD96]|uniref:Gfo/Idh/MocA family protein n=1 Tax=Aurantibrevibacter litoralis TaxID=3106030 RepID=UPI002B003740|nr:Gfo/Idh/MocA family oxidoreductase [Arenibacter sp. GZD-96]MEA1787099.1 Gfo/Idh/MocA family oxidoreductase [Arenibacter sp. GZD-96]
MKRRDFVIKGGLISAGTLMSSSALGSLTSGANDTINLGVIGTGDRGAGLIPFLNQIPGIRVTACCDVLPFRLEQGLAKVEQKAKGYADYRAILDRKDIDAVLVATPFYTHSQIYGDALEAGKHVYAEKTLAKGYEGINELVKKQKKSNTIFQTGHQYHSSRLYVHVAELIKNGKIGKIAAFQCQWNRNGNWRRPVPNPNLERAVNWRMYTEFSGGLVAELCSHQIDFVSWVLEAFPEKVMGVGGIDYWKDGRETYDNIHLMYSYPNGVKASFTCLTSNALDDYKIKVMGDKGTIVLDYQKAWFFPEGGTSKELGNVDGVSGATTNWEQGKGIPIEFEHADPSKQALIDFRDSIWNNTKPISDIFTGANTAVCVQMGLDAMRKDEIIRKPKHGFYSVN